MSNLADSESVEEDRFRPILSKNLNRSDGEFRSGVGATADARSFALDGDSSVTPALSWLPPGAHWRPGPAFQRL